MINSRPRLTREAWLALKGLKRGDRFYTVDLSKGLLTSLLQARYVTLSRMPTKSGRQVYLTDRGHELDLPRQYR